MIRTAEDLVLQTMPPEIVDETERLGVDSVHMLRHEDYIEHDDSGKAVSEAYSGHIYVDADEAFRYSKSPRISFISVMVHEFIHSHSHIKYFVEEGGVFGTHRIGYESTGKDDQEYHFHFRGFNEAVTSALTDEILLKNKEYLSKTLKLSADEWDIFEESGVSYKSAREILDCVIDGVADVTGQEHGEVWGKIREGVFTGEMMHLRDIEKAFGPGSLRVIAAIQVHLDYEEIGLAQKEDGDKQVNINQEILHYLNTEYLNEREKIANGILNKREKIMRDKRN